MKRLINKIRNLFSIANLFATDSEEQYLSLHDASSEIFEEAANFMNEIMDWSPSPEDIAEIKKHLPDTKEEYNNNAKIFFDIIQEEYILRKFGSDLKRAIDTFSLEYMNRLTPEDKMVHYFQMTTLFTSVGQLVTTASYIAIAFAYNQEKLSRFLDLDGYEQSQTEYDETTSFTPTSSLSLEDLFATKEELDIEEFNALVKQRGTVGDA